MEVDHLFFLNYAITLTNNDEHDKARENLIKFEELFGKLDNEAKTNDAEVLDMRQALAQALGVEVAPAAPATVAAPEASPSAIPADASAAAPA